MLTHESLAFKHYNAWYVIFPYVNFHAKSDKLILNNGDYIETLWCISNKKVSIMLTFLLFVISATLRSRDIGLQAYFCRDSSSRLIVSETIELEKESLFLNDINTNLVLISLLFLTLW